MTRRKIITVYLNGVKFMENKTFAPTVYSVETCITTSPEPEFERTAIAAPREADIKKKLIRQNIYKHSFDFLNIDINKKQYCLSRR